MLNAKKSALIGSSGFVGGNLLQQMSFTHTFNSKNISDIQQQNFDLVICAGTSATKWLANKEPDKDWLHIANLIENLKSVTVKHFILISTIDVYPHPWDVNETHIPTGSINHAYGRHRLQLEEFVQRHFSSYSIVRLPGLFGSGLKKNIIYDLINKNALELIQPKSHFQYYDLDCLCADLQLIVKNKIPLINITSEPLLTETIVKDFFPNLAVGAKPSNEIHYNITSIYAKLWGSNTQYQYSNEDILLKLQKFISKTLPGTIHGH